MGCFNHACGVTGNPILHGEEVVLMELAIPLQHGTGIHSALQYGGHTTSNFLQRVGEAYRSERRGVSYEVALARLQKMAEGNPEVAEELGNLEQLAVEMSTIDPYRKLIVGTYDDYGGVNYIDKNGQQSNWRQYDSRDPDNIAYNGVTQDAKRPRQGWHPYMMVHKAAYDEAVILGEAIAERRRAYWADASARAGEEDEETIFNPKYKDLYHFFLFCQEAVVEPIKTYFIHAGQCYDEDRNEAVHQLGELIIAQANRSKLKAHRGE